MTEQLGIDGTGHTIGATGKPLTDKQQRGYDLVRDTPGGITADELGAIFHADRGKHHPDSRCVFCGNEGESVLESKALGPLVIKRRVSGRYELRDASERVPEPAPVADLPGETFEDIFGDAA